MSDAREGPAGLRRMLPSSSAGRWAVIAAGLLYLTYFALLVTCDLWRVSFEFVPRFEAASVTVAAVQPSSTGAGAGLQPGDRLRRANGQLLAGPADWQWVRLHLDPSRPLLLEIERQSRPMTVLVPLTSGLAAWQVLPFRAGLLGFRFAQLVTLALALTVGLKRQTQGSALVGALLLASIATVSLALPMPMGALWNALPAPLGALLWIPFATSAAVGPLLFAFFAVFPRRLWPAASLGLSLVPAILVTGWHLRDWSRMVGGLGPPIGRQDSTPIALAINVAYAAAAVVLLLAHRRAAATLTDRRRIRVLIVGLVVGVAAGSGVIIGYWQNPGADIFATRTLTVLSLVFLAVPASFAYAILRHRLFDIRLIVRQGLRYALARRFVDALVPMLGVLVMADLLVHRAQPIGAMLQARWWWFALIGGALVAVRARREAWLHAIDRRFFRDRYDAQRLLRSIAEEITRAPDFETVAPAVLQRIDEALHPEFACVLRRGPGDPAFAAIPVNGADHPCPALPASLAVIGVLAVLRLPLALSRGDTAWVRHQLPIAERALLLEQGLELLVPVSNPRPGDPPLALLALGPRRSEEPYGWEDLDLLMTIAQPLAQLLERTATEAQQLTECSACGRCFDSRAGACPDDGETLEPSPGSRVLAGRYRLDRRLGRGGMGTVYGATDVVLDRSVAVKLIRADIAGPLDLVDRFRREARVSAALTHPHIVRVYDFGLDRLERPFLVMELLEGMTLRQRLATGTPLDVAETLHILRGLCAALGAAHGSGLVHRDMKPENVFLQRSAAHVTPKVLDFGLAKTFGPQWALERPTVSGSSAGLVIGTLDYMAPEQVAGDDVGPAWDLWATAVMAHEMLTGRHPFRRRLTLTFDEAALTAAVETAAVELPGRATTFFRRALSVDPAERPAAASELLAGCEEALA